MHTGKPLSVKTVKNIIIGTLRAMIREAMADELVTRDVFVGLTWPERDLPEPDPFSIDEVRRILSWFASKLFRFASVPGSRGIRRPPIHHSTPTSTSCSWLGFALPRHRGSSGRMSTCSGG